MGFGLQSSLRFKTRLDRSLKYALAVLGPCLLAGRQAGRQAGRLQFADLKLPSFNSSIPENFNRHPLGSPLCKPLLEGIDAHHIAHHPAYFAGF